MLMLVLILILVLVLTLQRKDPKLSPHQLVKITIKPPTSRLK